MKKYDTFWLRYFSLIIDGIVLYMIGILVCSIITKDNPAPLAYGMILTIINAPYLYSILFHSIHGQTPGKMLVNIRIVDVKTEERINFAQAVNRVIVPFVIANLLFALISILTWCNSLPVLSFNVGGTMLLILPSAIIIIWSVSELFTMLFNPKFRSVQDRIAKTIVVRSMSTSESYSKEAQLSIIR